MKKNIKNIIIYIILLGFAILISLEAYVSPLNKTGYLSTDVAVWISIAKKMAQGSLIYKDVFDHKGPMLYFIYYIGYTLAGIKGIWCIELISNIISVFTIYKIANLILKNKAKALIVVTICAGFIFGLCNENPCTESLSMPCILLSLYGFIKFTLNKYDFKIKESLYTGICFGIVLMLRPNIAVLWVVYYLYIFIKLIKEKDLQNLRNIILFSILGVIIVFFPIIMYFIKNNIIADFIQTYLLFNFKYMQSKEEILYSVILFCIIKTKYIIILIMICYALIILRKKLNKQEKELVIVSLIYFILTIYLVIIPQRNYSHYLITILPTIIIPISMCLKNMKNNKQAIKILCGIILIIYLSVYIIKTKIILTQLNLFVLGYQNISNKIFSLTKKDDNVLILGNNATIYIISDRQYNGKYIYQTPIANQDANIAKEIIAEIKNDLPQVILNTMFQISDENRIFTDFEKQIQSILDENYTTEDFKLYIKKGDKQ